MVSLLREKTNSSENHRLEQRLEGWRRLDYLGREYVRLYKDLVHEDEQGNPLPFEETPKMRSTKDEILTKIQRYLHYLMREIVFKGKTINLRGREVGLSLFGNPEWVNNREYLLNEVIQDANLAILENLHKYNPEFAFSQYVSLMFVTGVKRYMNKRRGLIRISIHRQSPFFWKCLSKSNGLEDFVRLVNKETGLKDNACCAIYFGLTNEYEPLFEEPQYKQEDGSTAPLSYEESLADESLSGRDPLKIFEKFELRENTRYVLSETRLTKRERDIISLHFGLDNNKELTLEEIGKRYGVTREAIRQIEAEAFKKLRRRTLNTPHLKEYLGS